MCYVLYNIIPHIINIKHVNIQPNTLYKTVKTTRREFYAGVTAIAPKRATAVENTHRFNTPIRKRNRSVRFDVLRFARIAVMYNVKYRVFPSCFFFFFLSVVCSFLRCARHLRVICSSYTWGTSCGGGGGYLGKKINKSITIDTACV